MDDLTEIMSLLRTSGHLYGRLDFSAPFAFEFPGYKGICLIVVRGSCFLGVDKEPLLPWRLGDFVLLPNPESYSLLSHPDRSITPGSRIVFGGRVSPDPADVVRWRRRSLHVGDCRVLRLRFSRK
jgi:hypothetical protein